MAKSVLTKCRTCLKSEKKLQLLEKQMGLKFTQVTYKEALIALTNITIQVGQEEYMPQGICNTCSRKLKAAQQFIKQAQDANSELLSLLCDAQSSSFKKLECLKRPTIDLDVNKYVQVKLEEELVDSNVIGAAIDSAVIAEDVLTIKEEDATHLQLGNFVENQEIIKKNLSILCDPVSIDPLPKNCFVDDISQISTSLITEKTSNKLKKHIKRTSAKIKLLEDDDLLPVACEDCGKVYDNAEQLARHKKSTHLPDELKIPCPNCGRKFSRRYNMYTHMRTFHGKESVENLLRPPESLVARKKFQCDKCPSKYTNIYKLHAHIRRVHDEADEKNKSTKCEIQKIKRTYTFLCTYCGLACCSKTALKVHTRRHTGEKPFKCDLCDKAYPRRYDVVMHRRTHTGEKPHVCTICSKAFRRPDKLSDHMRSHSNERPYKCTQCERCFKRPKELTIHMRVHTNGNSYSSTPICFNMLS